MGPQVREVLRATLYASSVLRTKTTASSLLLLLKTKVMDVYSLFVAVLACQSRTFQLHLVGPYNYRSPFDRIVNLPDSFAEATSIQDWQGVSQPRQL